MGRPGANICALPALNGKFPRRQRILNVLASDWIWKMGEAMPFPHKRDGGAPRKHPAWLIYLFEVLIHEFGSAVEVERELADPDTYALLIRAANDRYPDDSTMWPRGPLKRFHYSYAKARYLIAPGLLELAGEALVHQAAADAVATGMCVPEVGVSWTHPKIENVVSTDGKVIRARTKCQRVDRETGEIIHPRADRDVELYKTGDGEEVRGVGVVISSCRGPGINHRIILDVVDSPAAGGELTHAMRSLRRTLPLLPGAQVVDYDGAMRGKHRREIYGLGKLPVSPARRRDNPKPHERHYGPAGFRQQNGTLGVLEIHLIDGLPHISEFADDGTPIYEPLLRTKTTRPRPTSGATYNEYRVPDRLGGGTLRLRVTQGDDDEATGLNREEWLHAFAMGDPDYARLYARRSDAESGHRTLDDSMLRERAHSIGRPGILLNTISWAVYKNAQTVALYGRERAAPAFLAA